MTQNQQSPSPDPAVQELWETVYGAPPGRTAAPLGPNTQIQTASGSSVALNPPTGSPITVTGGVGAPQSYRLVGATVNGAPTSGVWNPGEVVPDQAGNLWINKGLLYPATILAEPGLLAYYRMDDAGTTLVDQKGLGNGTLHGGITKGALGATSEGNAAMSFNGTDAYVDSFPAGLTLATFPLSIECWLKGPAYDSARYIFGNTDGAPTNTNYSVRTSGAGSVTFTAGSGGSLAKTASGIDDGTYHHWIFTVSSAGALSIFRDGALLAGPSGSATPNTTGVSLSVGRTGPRNGNYYNGSVDEFAVYNVELTAAQALAHYNAGVASFFYKFVRPGEVDATVVHLAGAETLTGPKTFAAIPAFQQPLDLTKVVAPAAPPSGVDRLWLDSVSGMLTLKGSNGVAIPFDAGMITNPKAYGGVGDGIVDDTAALNSGYNNSGEGFQNIYYIGGGSWKYTSQLNWTTNKDIAIQGAGRQVTRLTPTAVGVGVTSLKLSGHLYGAVLRDLLISGPLIWASPSTNPGPSTGGADGLELGSGAYLEWVVVQNFDKNIVLTAGGGHNKLFHVTSGASYYNTYFQVSGYDDIFLDCTWSSPMFAGIALNGNGTALGPQFYRCHIYAAPFAFYHESGTSAGFVASTEGYQLSLEQLGNGAWYSENATTQSAQWQDLHLHNFGWTIGSAYRRTDKPNDYGVVIGTHLMPSWLYSSLVNHDKGAFWSFVDPYADINFLTGPVNLIFVTPGDGHAFQLKPNRGDTQGSATFAAASGNNATKLIGTNTWPGPPASMQLILRETTDGGLTNGFNLLAGAVTSSPTLVGPLAATAALIISAGNIDAGAHSYKVSFENGGLFGQVGSTGGGLVSNGVTNDASHAQTTVTLPTNGVTPVGSPTVTMSVWRNKVADQTHWFLVQSGIALGTASITDNLADASLGAAIPTTNTTGGWQATVTLKTAAGQTGNPSFTFALKLHA